MLGVRDFLEGGLMGLRFSVPEPETLNHLAICRIEAL